MVLEPLLASVGCDAKSLPSTISKLKLQAVSIATLSTEFRNNNACKTSPSVKRGCSLWGLGKVVTRSGSIKPYPEQAQPPCQSPAKRRRLDWLRARTYARPSDLSAVEPKAPGHSSHCSPPGQASASRATTEFDVLFVDSRGR